MALTNVATGDTITALSLNQILYYLQQPSGAQEYGNYFIAGNAAASTNIISGDILFESRGTLALSISLSTSDGMGGNASTPSTSTLTVGGAQVFCAVTGASANVYVGGPHTVQF